MDGEGTFSVLVLKRTGYKTGWNIIPVFTISLNGRDTALLEKIQHFFGSPAKKGVGKIYFRKKDNAVYFTVKSIKDLKNVIITHFEKFPLLTKKSVDFELFKEIVTIMYNKQHLDTDGLNKIMQLKYSLNKGFTPFLSENFPNVNPIKIQLRKSEFNNVNPHWITGFVEADGGFHIGIIKSEAYKTGCQIRLDFNVVQHVRDKDLMANLINYFNSGALYENTGHVTYRVTKLSDIQDKIIPFFLKYPLQGYKLRDFNKFCSVAELMKNKAHLTVEGLDKIIEIRNS